VSTESVNHAALKLHLNLLALMVNFVRQALLFKNKIRFQLELVTHQNVTNLPLVLISYSLSVAKTLDFVTHYLVLMLKIVKHSSVI
jgi:hypothetical protein